MSAVGDASVTAERRPSLVVGGAVGLLAGLVVGAVGTAVAVGWAIFTAANSQTSAHVPLLIDVAIVDDTVRADSGDGLVVPALIAALAGAAIGVGIQALRRRSSARRMTAQHPV